MPRQRLGNAILEYSLIGALVAVVVIPALALLSGAIHQGFSEMLSFDAGGSSSYTSGSAHPSNGSVSTATTTFSPSSSPAPSRSMSGTQPVSIGLAGGQSILIPNVPVNTAELVETLGTNGATRQLAQTIHKLADELIAEGELDTNQYNSLKDLANQGYLIAEAEKLVEDAAEAAGGDSSVWDRSVVNFQGIDYSVLVLVDEIGVKGVSTPGSMQRKLMDLYDVSLRDGSLQRPGARQLVDTMVSEISVLAKSFDNAAFGGMDPRELTKETVSGLTRVKSETICVTGNNQSTGLQCL